MTITVPTDGANTRYRFCDGCTVVSQRVAVSTWAFTTCVSGTCILKSNTTYYQLKNDYTITPQTPSTWDGAYSWRLKGTYIGIGNVANESIATINGGGPVTNPGVWYDYNRDVLITNPIGTAWTPNPSGSNSIVATITGGNIFNIAYSKLLLITNIAGFALTYTSGLVSGLTTTGDASIDYGTSLQISGLYTNKIASVTYALILYQEPMSGIQIYGDVALSNIQYFNTNPSASRITFTDSDNISGCHCQGFIPPALGFTLQNVFNNGVVNPRATFTNNLIDELGKSPHEWDFVMVVIIPPSNPSPSPAPPSGGGGGSIPTNIFITTVTQTATSINAFGVPVVSVNTYLVPSGLTILSAVMALIFLPLIYVRRDRQNRGLRGGPGPGHTSPQRFKQPKLIGYKPDRKTTSHRIDRPKTVGYNNKRPKTRGRRTERTF